MATDETINLLVVSTLFPNSVQKRHGIFVETRLRHLMMRGRVRATVIAPVPWYPFNDKKSAKYVKSSRIQRYENRDGVPVYHPRYLALPGLGFYLNPLFLWLSILSQALRLLAAGQRFDLIDGHYYYPDGIAVALMAKILRLPYTVTARGTDINLIPAYWFPRRLILWASRGADRSIAVCQALKDEMVQLGADESNIEVLRNGVDLNLFSPLERESSRQSFGICRPTLISVGHLIERKGHHLVIAALEMLPEFDLLIAGDGEEYAALKLQVSQAGLDSRVRFLGALSQPDLAKLYSAADALVLASSREGWANVLLEAMACGCPVVATRIWGTPEVVTSYVAGRLVLDRTPAAIAAEIRALFDDLPQRCETRLYAEQFSWTDTVVRLESLFTDLSGKRAA